LMLPGHIMRSILQRLFGISHWAGIFDKRFVE